MNNSTISTKVQADHINQPFEQFKSPLCVKFRSYLNSTLYLTDILRQGGLDQSSTVRAFEVIEYNAKLQSLLLEKLLKWHLTSNELDSGMSIKPSNVDHLNQQFEQFKSHLSVEFRLSLNCILCWTHLLRLGRLEQTSTVRAFEAIEYNTKLQSLLLDKLLNWRVNRNKLDLVVSSEPSNDDGL